MKRTPKHLRLHADGQTSSDDLEVQLDLPGLNGFLTAFEELTGHALEYRPQTPAQADQLLGSFARSVGGDLNYLCLSSPTSSPPRTTSDTSGAARRIGQSLARIIAELQTTREALWQREAELATAVPVVVNRQNAAQLSVRLQSILRGAVEGLGGTAAAMYLLDDATSQLKLRAHWGLPTLRFVEPARSLRGAFADLEALTGHAVVIDDARAFGQWNLPECFESAVCVPLAGENAILGTLWLFCDHVRDFSSRETHLLEIMAGGLVVEIERRVLLNEASSGRVYKEHFEQAGRWWDERCRLVPLVVDGWCASNAFTGPRKHSADFHFWRMMDDDRFVVGAAGFPYESAAAPMTAAMLRGALISHLQHTSAPDDVLAKLNDVLWSISPSGGSAGIFLARIDPDSGWVESCSAGCTDAYILRPHGWEPIVSDGLPLGADPATSFALQRHHIAPGDILLAMSDRNLAPHKEPGPDTTRVAEKLLRHSHLPPNDLAALGAQLIDEQVNDERTRAILVVKRQE